MKAPHRDDHIDHQIAGPLRDAHVELDQLHRARLGSALEAALDREDQARRTPASRRSWRWLAGGSLALAAAAAAVLVWRRAPQPVTMVAPAPVVARAPAPVAPPLLVPHGQAGEGGPTPATSLVALAGEMARATIGARVRLTLVGPGRVSVLAAAQPGDLELLLEGGRLLADYDGRPGGTLRVRSPGAVTTIVGTLFAVEATPFGSRVAVAHGRVRTQDASGRQWQVGAGTNWSSADERLSPLPRDLAVALREHELSWAGNVPATATATAPRRPAPAPPAVRPAQPAEDLDALYARAEAAMRRRDNDEARRILEVIATRDPAGGAGELALLDLARLALAQGDRSAARQVLARLPVPLHDPALDETAAHLRCRAAEGAGGDCPDHPGAAQPR
jgi:hypothetical protein